MEYKKNKIKILIITISIVGLLILLGLYGFTVISIQQVEELRISEKFDPKILEKLVKRPLKKEEEDFIEKKDMLRVFGKWIAVGGPTALSGFNETFIVLSSILAGIFLLYDP